MPSKKKKRRSRSASIYQSSAPLTYQQIVESENAFAVSLRRRTLKIKKVNRPAMRISCEIFEGRKADLIP